MKMEKILSKWRTASVFSCASNMGLEVSLYGSAAAPLSELLFKRSKAAKEWLTTDGLIRPKSCKFTRCCK